MRNWKMGCMKLGTKADVFHLEGQSWLCTTGLPSDVCIEVGEMSFHLHKFPLLSRSQLLEKLIQDFSASQKNDEETKCVLSLHGLPGGAKTFLLIAKFCYGVKFELTAADVVGVRCAAEYLQMNEDYGEGNLVSQTEVFLDEVLRSWVDTIIALETCDKALPLVEELHIISRCIDSLATKATKTCSNPTLFSWPISRRSAIWNKTHSASKSCPKTDDWWYEDVTILKLPLFKRLMVAVGSKGMAPDIISGAVMFYAKSYIPLDGRQLSFSQRNPGSTIPVLSDADQMTLIEEIVVLLPNQKGVTPTNFLLRLLRTSVILHASPSSLEILEKMIGAQLDQAVLRDILIPNAGYSMETLYDIECVQRMVNHFSFVDHKDADPKLKSVIEDNQLAESSHSVTPTTVVANLLDDYLAEVALDVKLKLENFMSLAGSIPDYARQSDDGLYRAIDIYLKAHPWLAELERQRLCRLTNCEKLSSEAITHAAQNKRLPLRFILQVLMFEQLRLRTSVANMSFVSDNLENSQNLSGNMARTNNPTIPPEEGQIFKLDALRQRVSELEREHENLKHELEMTLKTNRSRSNFFKRFGWKLKEKSVNHQEKAVLDGKRDN